MGDGFAVHDAALNLVQQQAGIGLVGLQRLRFIGQGAAVQDLFQGAFGFAQVGGRQVQVGLMGLLDGVFPFDSDFLTVPHDSLRFNCSSSLIMVRVAL